MVLIAIIIGVYKPKPTYNQGSQIVGVTIFRGLKQRSMGI